MVAVGGLIRQRSNRDRYWLGVASYTRKAPRRFEAHRRPEARAAFEKQRTFPRSAQCDQGACDDGAGSGKPINMG